MEPDLTKLGSTTIRNAFKNNKIYEGTQNVTGSTAPGLNVREFSVPLEKVPDLISALFNGPTDTVFGNDPRPGNAWFKKGYVWVLGNNAGAGYFDYPTAWRVTMRMEGLTAIIRMSYIQQFSDGLTLTSTPFSYRILDYSVF